MSNYTEIFIGITAPIGVKTKIVEDYVTDFFESIGFTTNVIKVSSYLQKICKKQFDISIKKNEIESVLMLQDLGDFLRIESQKPEYMMFFVINQIKNFREKSKKNRVVHIIKSFKHPEEVFLMKHTYKDNFFLLGVFSDLKDLYSNISYKYKQHSKGTLKQIIKNDKNRKIERNQFLENNLLKKLIENNKCDISFSKYTQKVEQTLHLSDVLVNVSNISKTKWILKRFLNLLMSSPFETPTLDEMCMFVAKSYSLRSGSAKRQVGACICNDNGSIISVGCNEVPKVGGGYFWPAHDAKNDNRDFLFFRKKNINYLSDKYIKDTLNYIYDSGWEIKNIYGKPETDLIKDFRKTPIVSASTFRDRDCHAEMSALMDAAERGVCTKGATLFCTTFPCHNCAKHIIASGIKKVVYIEPYPKSEAFNLWPNQISNEPNKFNAIPFSIFNGISPNIYIKFFSPVINRKIENKKSEVFFTKWKPKYFRNQISKWSDVPENIKNSNTEKEVLKSLPNKLLKQIKSVDF